jgi:hypothetical protein
MAFFWIYLPAAQNIAFRKILLTNDIIKVKDRTKYK